MSGPSAAQRYQLILADIAMAAVIETCGGAFEPSDRDVYAPGALRNRWLDRNKEGALRKRVTAMANAGIGALQQLPFERLQETAARQGARRQSAEGEPTDRRFACVSRARPDHAARTRRARLHVVQHAVFHAPLSRADRLADNGDGSDDDRAQRPRQRRRGARHDLRQERGPAARGLSRLRFLCRHSETWVGYGGTRRTIFRVADGPTDQHAARLAAALTFVDATYFGERPSEDSRLLEHR